MTKTGLFAEYATYHTDRRNRFCHAFGIPLIVLGLEGLLALMRVGPLGLAIPVAAALLAYYAAIDARGAVITVVVFAAFYAVAVPLPWTVSLAALLLGWVFQLVGHRFEGNQPYFFEELGHAFEFCGRRSVAITPLAW
ncbi:MAG: Mpo1-like protein [Vulcanimicrobiaceae bacterium]